MCYNAKDDKCHRFLICMKKNRLFDKQMINKHLIKLMALVLIGALYADGLSFLVDKSVNTIRVSAAEIEEAVFPLENNEIKPFVEEDEFLLDEEYPRRYAGREIDLLEDLEALSVVTAQVGKRDIVYVLEEGDEYTKIMTEDNQVGYVNSEYLYRSLKNIFDYANETKYSDGELILWDSLNADANEVATLDLNEEVKLTGTNDLQYWKAKYDGKVVYVDKDHLMDEEEIIEPEPTPEPQQNNNVETISRDDTKNNDYNGAVLTPSAGTIIGPSGKETYYNLDMSGVISIMKGAGYNEEYWVRDDGVKMYGDYVLAACAFDIRPRGSLVETSLGTAICADTGGFAYGNPTQIDIATNW